MAKKILLILTLLFLSLLLYKDSFNNFFYQDDFFNMALANRQGPLAAFNIFVKPPADFYFYRPLTTQFFWWLGQKIFAYNPFDYHLLIFIFFLINSVLVFILTKQLTKDVRVAFLTTSFYTLSDTHFYRLFFLSQFQEILLTTLVLTTLIFYIRGNRLYLVSFILALMAKETAAIVPPILASYELLFSKRRWGLLVGPFLILLIYFLLRKFFFGFAGGATYDFNFYPKTIINNYLWYGFWSLGLPETYVNLKIFTWPTIINPKFLTEFGIWGNRTLFFLLAFLAVIAVRIREFRKEPHSYQLILFGLLIFAIGLLPVAFFPFHKFAYSLTLPLIGVALVLAVLLKGLKPAPIGLFLVLYFFLSYSATQFNLSNHWARKRAETARMIWQYLRQKYPSPQLPGSDIYFVDRPVFYCWPKHSKFQQSQEVAYAIGGDGGLKLLYQNPDVKIYFEDWDNFEHLSRFSLILDSNKFLL